MKKVFRIMALCTVLGTLAVSCQKEQTDSLIPGMEEANATYSVCYYIDGVEHMTVLHGDEEWNAFLSWMLALSKDGRQVYFRNLNATGTTAQTKEVIV